jgi:replicative DNA helicase
MEINYFGESMIESQERLEKIVIGEILITKESIYNIASELKIDLFTDTQNRLVCKAILDLFKSNTPIDIVSLSQYLLKFKKIEEVGGISFISQLTEGVVSASNLEYHFKLLQESYIRRKIVDSCNEIRSKSLSNDEDVFDIIEEHGKIYSEVLSSVVTRKYKSVSEVHNELLKQHILTSDGNGFSGVPTELKLVDNLTNGWQKSDLIILAGRPAMGKTSCAIVFALNPAITHNIPVAFFSLEMSSEQVVSRMQSILTEIDVSRLVKKQLKGYEIVELEKNAKVLAEAPIYIDDTPSISILELKSKARQLVREQGVKILIIDYLQLMRSGNKHQSREQEIGEISRGLKAIAKELNVPVIALSQLSRAVEGRVGQKKPQLSDLRESGQIEQDADMVMFCYRPEYYEIEEYEINGETYPSRGMFLLLVAKHRNGSLGDIPLRFIHQNTNIVNNPNFLPQVKEVPQISNQSSALKSHQTFESENNGNEIEDFWDESPF